MMRTRILAVGAMALTAAGAFAQFDGPAPLAWRFLQPTTVAPSGSPLVMGDNIYTSMGGRVFSIDRPTGNLKWRYPQLDPIAGTFRSAPVMASGVLIAVGDNKIVYGIDPATGESKWTSNVTAGPLGQPVIVDDKYIAIALSNNTVVLISATDGQPVWTAPFKVDAGLVGSIAVSGSDVLVFDALQELLAVNATTQKVDWKRTFQQLPPTAQPVVFGDSIYVYSGPYLVSLFAATGLPKWQVDTGLQPAYSPAVGADGIAVVGADGKAMVYDLSRQPLLKTPIDLGSGPVASPIITGTYAQSETSPAGTVSKKTVPLFVVPTSNGALNLVNPLLGVKWSFIVQPLDLGAAATSTTGGRAALAVPAAVGQEVRAGAADSAAVVAALAGEVLAAVVASGVVKVETREAREAVRARRKRSSTTCKPRAPRSCPAPLCSSLRKTARFWPSTGNSASISPLPK